MAIAFDASASGIGASPTLTFAHTCTGSNRLLIVGAMSQSGDVVTGVTYNGVAMTQIQHTSANGEDVYLFSLVAPATGANNVVVSSSSGDVYGTSVSYTGVAQVSPDDGSSNGTTTAITTNLTVTTTVDNDWLVGGGRGLSTANTNSTRRVDAIFDMFDTNAAQTPAGSKTMVINTDTAGFPWVAMGIEPAVAASGPANLKTYNTNPIANIKSINTNLIANVKSLNTNV